jgi:D-alanyl-D-alanine carboxypeptidase/D-alanyl-D-alanine-endopeptidase (penicillin-binding protein 4)
VVVATVLVLGAAALVGGYAATRAIRGDPRPLRIGSPPPALRAATAVPTGPTATGSAGAAPVPAAAAVAALLRPALAAVPLGGEVHADVLDATTGAVLYADGADAAGAPASTAKLLTAAAVLATRGPDYRITTTVRTDGAGTVVLVGVGDPTLSGAATGTAADYPDAGRLADLASAVRAAHVPVTSVVVDDTAFTGPTVSPAWAPGDAPSDYAAPITALMTDGGRAVPGATIRSAAPDLDAARRFAALLGAGAVPVQRGRVAAADTVVATVRSAPIATLVTQMLQASDNVIAECLARQVAIAGGGAPSFVGAAAAVRATLAGLGADPGPGMLDGSGLAAADRLSAAALATLLRVVSGSTLRALHDVLSALPVAGWSGTLADRYLTGRASAAAGAVRAKTGTLTGVSTLAGVVHDADGRLLVFALLADRVPAGAVATAGAESALDAAVSTLAGCGCR